jgi:short-subunit dehydrogenase
VNIASIGGLVAIPHLLAYSASKFAEVGLSLGLRSELGKDGIVVTTVCPGLMRTGSARRATIRGRHEAEYAWFAVSAAMPLLTWSAKRAARRIVLACRRGEARVVLGIPARVLYLVSALAPDLAYDALGLAARLLPSPPDRTDGGPQTGEDSESAVTRSPLLAFTRWAERRENERAAPGR